jgi:PPOX class probable F420-dependent enzyme
MRATTQTFAPLAASRTALLTTFRHSGAAVPTPVSIGLEQGRVYFVTATDSGKAKRLARDPNVTLAPCTAGGHVLGATVRGRARLLQGEERRRARRLLRPTRPLFWSFLLYRLRGKAMRLYEVTPT